MNRSELPRVGEVVRDTVRAVDAVVTDIRLRVRSRPQLVLRPVGVMGAEWTVAPENVVRERPNPLPGPSRLREPSGESVRDVG